MEKEFIFNNQAENLYPVLQEMMSHVRSLTPNQKVTGRCTVILTELLTNAIKHAGVAPTRIRLSNDGFRLNMIKLDNGRMFLPEVVGSPANAGSEQKIVLSADQMSELFAIRENAHKLKFGVEDHPLSDDLQIDGLVEHYGLLLITKASDEFYYEFEQATNSNIFRSLISL